MPFPPKEVVMLRFMSRGFLLLFCFFCVANATTISGTVTDSVAGTKLANVIVSVNGQGFTTLRDTTDATGAYSLPEAKIPGNFTARATVAGYITKSSAITIDTATATMTVNFAIVKIDTTTIAGIISDSASGTPISGAIVTTSGGRRDTTKDDGKYVFVKMASGSYTVSTSAPSYVGKNTTVVVSGTDTVKANVALAKIAYATVSGTISDSASAAPITNAIVSLRMTNGTSKVDTTKADGKYSFDSVATGTYTVRASAIGYNNRTSPSTAVSGAAVTVNVALIKIVYGSIYGIIADSASGTPITGAIITTSGRRDTTKADGVFTFDSLAAGTYSLGVSAPLYNGRTVNTAVASSGTDTANVKLLKIVYGSIYGIIADSATGTPIAGAIVTTGGNRRDTTKADGVFAFASLTLGTYSLGVSAPYYNGRTVNTTVATSGTDTANVKLLKIVYGSVSGTISDSITSGTFVSNAIVTIRANNNSPARIDTTGSDGKYSFDSVAVGTYTVSVASKVYNSKTATANVTTSAAVTVDFALIKTLFGSVVGIVTDSTSGIGLKSATITVRSGGTVIKTGTTDADGKYTLDSIPVGVYTVRASDSAYSTKSVTDSVKTSLTDTTNFKLVKPISAVIAIRKSVPGAMSVFATTFGELVLKNAASAGELKLFGLNGKLLYKTNFTEQTNSIALPKNIVGHGNAYVVRISSQNSIYQKSIMIP